MFEFNGPDEEQKTIEAMEEFGGSFVKQLAKLYMLADSINKNRLLDSFGEYFKHYATGHTEAINVEKPTVTVLLSMTDLKNEGHGHHLAVNVQGTPEDAEHMFVHFIMDPKNKIGMILRNIMKRGIPMSEEEALMILGDDLVDLVDKKARQAEPKKPN